MARNTGNRASWCTSSRRPCRCGRRAKPPQPRPSPAAAARCPVRQGWLGSPESGGLKPFACQLRLPFACQLRLPFACQLRLPFALQPLPARRQRGVDPFQAQVPAGTRAGQLGAPDSESRLGEPTRRASAPGVDLSLQAQASRAGHCQRGGGMAKRCDDPGFGPARRSPLTEYGKAERKASVASWVRTLTVATARGSDRGAGPPLPDRGGA